MKKDHPDNWYVHGCACAKCRYTHEKALAAEGTSTQKAVLWLITEGWKGPWVKT
jgi:hypothetical protein